MSEVEHTWATRLERGEGAGGRLQRSGRGGGKRRGSALLLNATFEQEGELRTKDPAQCSGSRYQHHWTPLTADDL